MNRTYAEEWRFRISVLRVGKSSEPQRCRLGFEAGDVFECHYETPGDFCPKSMLKVFPLMEAVRSGGDLRNLGGEAPCGMTLTCPDGEVVFRIVGTRRQEE